MQLFSFHLVRDGGIRDGIAISDVSTTPWIMDEQAQECKPYVPDFWSQFGHWTRRVEMKQCPTNKQCLHGSGQGSESMFYARLRVSTLCNICRPRVLPRFKTSENIIPARDPKQCVCEV